MQNNLDNTISGWAFHVNGSVPVPAHLLDPRIPRPVAQIWPANPYMHTFLEPPRISAPRAVAANNANDALYITA